VTLLDGLGPTAPPRGGGGERRWVAAGRVLRRAGTQRAHGDDADLVDQLGRHQVLVQYGQDPPQHRGSGLSIRVRSSGPPRHGPGRTRARRST